MKILVHIILFISISLPVFSQEKIDIKSAIEKALLNNYSIRIAKTTNSIAANNVAPGNAGMLPKVDVVAGYNYSSTDLYMVLVTGQRIEQSANVSKTVNGGVQLSWTILDDMAMFISYDRLKSLKEKSDIEFKISVENTVKDISRTYYNALLIKKNLEVLQESISLSNRRLQRIEDRIDFGASTSLELLRAKVDLNTDSSTYKRTELNYNNALRTLIYLMGDNLNIDYQLDDDVSFISNRTLEEFRQLAQKSNNNILQAVQNKKITELDYKLIQTNFMPRLN